MADKKISELDAQTGAQTADDDVFVIADVSANVTKKITLSELDNALAARDFNFGDNTKLLMGDGNDLEIFHNASDSIINDAGTGSLKLQTGGSTKLEVTSGGVTVTGSVTGSLTGNADTATQIYVTDPDPDTNASHYILGVASTGSGNKAVVLDGGVRFNPSSNLLTASSIFVTGIPTGSGYVGFEGATGDDFETFLYATDATADRAIYLPDLSGTLTVTGAAQNVDFGTVTADGLTVSGDAVFTPDNDGVRITGANYATLRLEENDTTDLNTTIFNSSGAFSLYTSNDARSSLTQRLNIDHSTGDISFYEDTGSTAKLQWSASNERLGLTGSDYQFYIQQGSNQPWYNRAVSDGSYRLHLNGTGDIITADGSGNVGINMAPDSAVKLSVSGAIGPTNGSASSPTHTFYGDPDTGMYRAASDTLAFSVGSIEAARFNSSGGAVFNDTQNINQNFTVKASGSSNALFVDGNGGNVGISTTSPSPDYGSDTVLEVKGSTSPGIVINDTGQASKYGIHADSNDLKITYGSGALVSFQNDGNVGIGTSDPHDAGANFHMLTLNGAKGGGIVFSDDDVNQHQIYTTDDASLRFARGSGLSDESMRIDSSGRVMIAETSNSGYSNNADDLIVGDNGSATERGISLGSTLASTIRFNDGSDAGIIEYVHSDNSMRFGTTNGTERMRLDSNGQIGLSGSTASFDTTGAVNGLQLYYETDSGLATIGSYGGSTGSTALTFHTNSGTSASQEHMRLTSAGQLLVGPTTYNSNNASVLAGADGALFATRDGDIPAQFNRLTSNGTILGLQKDGTTVGSIASRAGVVSSIILDPRSGGGGLTGGGAALYPTDNAGATSDDALSLGDSSSRFKDLYLSGGVYLGGTVSANKLDDYEEGTWTVNLHKGGSALAVTNRYGYYTRVGDLCYLSFYWYNSSLTTTGTSVWGIRGMPFNVVALANSAYQFCPVGYNTLNSTNVHRWQANSSTELQMYGSAGATNVSSSALELSGTGVFRVE